MSSSSAAGCRLTMHVLDVAAGRPAADVAVTLVGLSVDGETDLGSVVTDGDGRSAGPAGAWATLAPGTHELRVDLGGHFARSRPGEACFYDIVPVRFLVGAADTHIHLALLVSPWSYTTYRGS